MRHLYLLITLALVFSGQHAFSQEEEYTFWSMKEQQLSGPVKSVSLTSFSAKPDGKGGTTKVAPGHQYSWHKNTSITYNSAGATVSATELLADGTISSETTFSYLNGLLSEIRSGGSAQIFEYDDAGRLAICGEKSTVAGDEGFYVFRKYEYNAANQVVRIVETDGEGNWEGGIVYTYDARGNRTSMKDDYENGYFETYTYNAGNQLIRSVVKDEEGTQEVTTYVYDGKKTIETWEAYEEGAYSGKVVYTYENGLEIKSVEYDGAVMTETQVTTYEFDANRNWTRKVVAINGKQFFIEERTITYY